MWRPKGLLTEATLTIRIPQQRAYFIIRIPTWDNFDYLNPILEGIFHYQNPTRGNFDYQNPTPECIFHYHNPHKRQLWQFWLSESGHIWLSESHKRQLWLSESQTRGHISLSESPYEATLTIRIPTRREIYCQNPN